MNKKFRLNWVDLLILVLMIVLVAGTYVKFHGASPVTSVEVQVSPITYQVLIASVRQDTVNVLRAGDTLYDDESKREIGVIQAVDAVPALTLASDTGGGLNWAETDGRYDVYLTVEGKGTVSGNTYTINRSYTLNVGSIRAFYTKYSAWQGRIWSIGE